MSVSSRPPDAVKRVDRLELIGGHPALDFANTAGNHESDHRSEWLTSYAEVTGWARRAGLLDDAGERALDRAAERLTEEAERARREIVDLREAVYRLYAALAQRQAPHTDDLAALHAARVRALVAAEPVWMDGYALQWSDEGTDLLRPVHPVAAAALDLLDSGDLARLKQCGNHPCGWLFIDRSRNRSRRWCSSRDCGNLTRVRRFRKRQREPR